MYNVLEKLRSGEALTAKEKGIHEQGLVSVLKQLHDDLDAAVFEAYGWSDLSGQESGSQGSGKRLPTEPRTLNSGTTATILTRLVALNAARAAEEADGQIRWLRPEYQQRSAVGGMRSAEAQTELALPERKSRKLTTADRSRSASRLQAWPAALPAQVQALCVALQSASGPMVVEALAARFRRAQPERITELLETLVIVGQARKLPDGRYAGLRSERDYE